MTFWSGAKIKENPHVITEFSETQIDCNCYTLRMGNCYYRTADEHGTVQKKVYLKDGEPFIIPAGQFAYLLSKETVNIPSNAMAFISMRTGLKLRGLINVSGFHVDPGYCGKLIFAVFNAGPLAAHLSESERLFKIWFCDLDRSSENVFTFKAPGLTDITNDLVGAMGRPILSLQSLSDKLNEQEASVTSRFAELKGSIDFLTFFWRAIIIGMIVAVFVAVLPYAGYGLQQAWENALGWLVQEAPPLPTNDDPATTPPSAAD